MATDFDASKIKYCRFKQYESNNHYSIDDLRKLNESGDLLARVENSGSESCYVEVARWSEKRQRWECFCFEKMMDVCFLDRNNECLDIRDYDKGILIAEYINGNEDAKFIASLPRWEG